MGMYTEIYVTGSIAGHREDAVLVLKHLFGHEDIDNRVLDTLDFDPWGIGKMSCSFPAAKAVSKIWEEPLFNEWHFTSTSSIKNYNGQIEQFFSWLTEQNADYFGYSRYEEAPLALTIYSNQQEIPW